MRKLIYPAIFEPNGKGGYSVFFPDVPGCISWGDSFDHAVKMAQEALELHIYGLEKDGEELPVFSNEVPEAEAGSIVVMVSIFPDLVKDEMDNRRVKTNITLPYWLKTAAEQEGINFSRLLETTLRDVLNIR